MIPNLAATSLICSPWLSDKERDELQHPLELVLRGALARAAGMAGLGEGRVRNGPGGEGCGGGEAAADGADEFGR